MILCDKLLVVKVLPSFASHIERGYTKVSVICGQSITSKFKEDLLNPRNLLFNELVIDQATYLQTCS
jgi:hypothetical protein